VSGTWSVTRERHLSILKFFHIEVKFYLALDNNHFLISNLVTIFDLVSFVFWTGIIYYWSGNSEY
jgi:hypothetical protein